MLKKITTMSRPKMLLLGLVAGTLVAGPIATFAIGTETNPPSEVPPFVHELDTLAPSIPQGLMGSDITHNSITVGWSASVDDDPEGIIEYQLRYNGTEVDGITSQGYILMNLEPETSYAIEVRALDAAGNTSAYSTQLVVSTVAKPVEEPTTPNPTTPTTPTPDPTPTTPSEPDENSTDDQATEADLQAAIAIAYADHQAEVVLAKLVYLNSERVYKVVFADGWRAYVRASDGDLVMLKDWFNVSKPVSHNAKKAWMKSHHYWKPFARDYHKWTNNWWKNHSWKGYYGGQNGWYSQDWRKKADKSVESTTEQSSAQTQVNAQTSTSTERKSTENKKSTKSSGDTHKKSSQSNGYRSGR